MLHQSEIKKSKKAKNLASTQAEHKTQATYNKKDKNKITKNLVST